MRLYLFHSSIARQARLGTLVVSVGNITVGGTGKTPVVELLARTLTERGRKVAILTRGYKSAELDEAQEWKDKDGRQVENLPKIASDGRTRFLSPLYSGDEPFMLAKNLDGVAVLVDKNRIKSGIFAIEHLGCDTLLLDDGMQYLKLAHELDIALTLCDAVALIDPPRLHLLPTDEMIRSGHIERLFDNGTVAFDASTRTVTVRR